MIANTVLNDNLGDERKVFTLLLFLNLPSYTIIYNNFTHPRTRKNMDDYIIRFSDKSEISFTW